MHKILFSVSILLMVISIYFLSEKEESWDVKQYRENVYIDSKEREIYQNIPVIVTIKSSTYPLGFGLVIIGACVFLSGIYLYSKGIETSEGISKNSIT